MKCSKCGIDKEKILEDFKLIDSIIRLQAEEVISSLEDTIATLNESTKRHNKE